MGNRWTWDATASGVPLALAGPATDLRWCDGLEYAGGNVVIGKVLCVCAALAIAREVIGPSASGPTSAALDLLADWIDDPTDERFDRICGTIFPPTGPPDLGPHGIVRLALRTATSSVGNDEAGWALGAVCGAATRSGFEPETLRAVAEREVLARQKHAEPFSWPDSQVKN